MSVTGLPAAAQAVLATLLEKERLTSWKTDSHGTTTVVVFRFKSTNELPSSSNGVAHWRRKPPSQLRRDQQRRNNLQTRFAQSSSSRVTLQPSEPLCLYDENCDDGRSSVFLLEEAQATNQETRENRSERARELSDCATLANVSSPCPTTQSDLCSSTKIADAIPPGDSDVKSDEATSANENNREVSREDLKNFFDKLGEKFQTRMLEEFENISISTTLNKPAISSLSTEPAAAASCDVSESSKGALDLLPPAAVDVCDARDDQSAPTVSKVRRTLNRKKYKQKT